jgi:hypothetical protein
MPFFGKFSCFSFTYSSVRQNAPQCSGVYAISNASEWLFVGLADNLQSALHQHLMEVGTVLRSKGATGFTFEACDSGARQALLERLVTELRPACNPAYQAPL